MIRFQLEFDEESYKDLDQMMSDCHLRTKKDLLNNALTLWKRAIRGKKKGAILCEVYEQEKVYCELVIPALEAVRPEK